MSIDLGSFLNDQPRAKKQPPQDHQRPEDRRHYQKREGRQTYTRWIRWPISPEQSPKPASVEVVGSFTDWRRVPLMYDGPAQSWNVALREVVGNRTHHYVILIDGKPSFDSTCDGLAVPQGPRETQYQIYQIATPKGPRVMLMFGQTR